MADGVTEARNGNHSNYPKTELRKPGAEEYAAEALFLRNWRSSDQPEWPQILRPTFWICWDVCFSDRRVAVDSRTRQWKCRVQAEIGVTSDGQSWAPDYLNGVQTQWGPWHCLLQHRCSWLWVSNWTKRPWDRRDASYNLLYVHYSQPKTHIEGR